MGDIVLSAGVRQNLLSLQNTAHLMGITQNRLATGKKVNSALDNPTNFFTSQSLQNRAGDLNALLDSIGQAQQTLDAANKGLTSLTKLVESAKSIVKQARQTAEPTTNTFAPVTVTGTAQTETLGSTGNGAAVTLADNTTYSFTVEVNGGAATTISYTTGTSATNAELVAGLQGALDTALGAGRITVAANDTDDGLRLTAANADTDFTITSAANSGLTAGTYASTSLLDNIIAGGGIDGASGLTIAVNGSVPQTITFGSGPGEISTMAELNAALANINGLTANVSGTTSSFSIASAAVQTNLTMTATAGVETALGIPASFNQNGALVSTTTVNPTRANLQSDYNDILTQIDALARDASYNGINLLTGDDLKVVFNEEGSSNLIIKGVTFSAAGLGMTPATGNAFQSNAGIDGFLSQIDTALTTLRTQASRFGANLNTVQTRQDFTKQMINTLQTGADALVLADTNEEGANLLALQTRQQLSSTALSMAAQADQAVLRLFG